MPILESFTTATSIGTAESLTIDKPSGVEYGDMLFLLCGNDNDKVPGAFIHQKTGWDWHIEYGDNDSDNHVSLWTRIANGTEGTTETVDAYDPENMWGVYGRISGAQGIEADKDGASLIFGSPGYEWGSTTNSAPEITGLNVNFPWLAFYVLGFDGSDASFSVSGTGWSEEAEVKQGGDSGTEVSGTFGSKDMSDGGDTGSPTITSTVSDGSVSFVFAVRPITHSEWSMIVADYMVLVEGWDGETEDGSLRQLCYEAQEAVGNNPDDDFGLQIRNRVVSQITAELGTAGGSEREKETNAIPGQIYGAMVDAYDHFAEERDEDLGLI